MKKSITRSKAVIIFAMMLLPFTGVIAQTRYLNNVFSSVTLTPNVLYGHNMSVLLGSPNDTALLMDVYQPAGDTCTSRPVVIYLHAGTYLPIVYNQACVGTKSDSSVVEICKQFARKGYVAVSMDYRLGWGRDAIGVNPDLVTGTIFQAAYRSIQDAKACVRYLKANASTYGIDTTKIAMGGVGAGAITALNYVALHDTLQLWLQKLISNTTTGPFVAGMPYLDFHTLGDFEGYGGVPQLNNPNNSPGHTTNIQMVFSIYGEIGDSSSSWIHSSFPPTVSLHPRTPPTCGGPYNWGTICAGNIGFPVLPDISGPHQYICKFDANGVNNVFTNAGFNDVYTTHANTLNGGCEGLYPFATATSMEDMWDWYDSTTMCFVAQALGLTCQDGKNAYYASVTTNPNMSKTQALAYIDTIQNYLAPRLVKALQPNINNCSTLGIAEMEMPQSSVSVFPNPATDHFTVQAMDNESLIRSFQLFDLTGRMVQTVEKINKKSTDIKTKSLAAGLYTLKIGFDKGTVTKKISVQ